MPLGILRILEYHSIEPALFRDHFICYNKPLEGVENLSVKRFIKYVKENILSQQIAKTQ